MSNEKYDDLFTAEDEKPIDYKAILFEYLMYWPGLWPASFSA